MHPVDLILVQVQCSGVPKVLVSNAALETAPSLEKYYYNYSYTIRNVLPSGFFAKQHFFTFVMNKIPQSFTNRTMQMFGDNLIGDTRRVIVRTA